MHDAVFRPPKSRSSCPAALQFTVRQGANAAANSLGGLWQWQGGSTAAASLPTPADDLPAPPRLQELDVDFSMAVGSSLLLEQLSWWLGEEAVAARHTLRSLRLGGALNLATVFGRMAPFAADFRLLEVSLRLWMGCCLRQPQGSS